MPALSIINALCAAGVCSGVTVILTDLVLLVRLCCCCVTGRQLGVFAEFRQDWPGAVLCYQAAAAALQGVPLGRPTVSCQRHAEVAAVAEVVHFKAMMLLLHQQRHAEAVQQLATHLAVFGRIPGEQAAFVLVSRLLSRMGPSWAYASGQL